MAVVNQVSKRVKMSQWDAIKFQLLTHCYLTKTQVSDASLDCVTHLAVLGESELPTLCSTICSYGVFKSAQTVRNALAKAEKKGLIVKVGKNKKLVALSPGVEIFTKGNILLNYSFLGIETN